MDKFEKLVNQIIKECEADGEPVTREEAEEMAKMEIGAKEIKNYAQSIEPRKERKPRERKPDEEKEKIISNLAKFLENSTENVKITNISKIIEFDIGENHYKLDLVRQRKPKK